MREPSKPRTFEIRLSMLVLAGCVVLAAIVVGVGAYLVGKGSGENLDAARAAGTRAGLAEGTGQGATRGYAVGFRRGRERAFERAYASAYKDSYSAAFDDAGLEAPARAEIAVPAP